MSLLPSTFHDDKARDELLELQDAFASFDKMAEGSNQTITVEKLADVLREYLVKNK